MLAARMSGIIAIFLAAPSASADTVMTEYKGVCEASAGSYVDNDHFLIASDESNVLRMYKRGAPAPVANLDLQKFTGFDKSDLEGAAKIGDRIYWISSHSFNSKGKDREKRRVFFATKTTMVNGVLQTEGVGTAITTLRNGIASAAQVAEKDINIEGLAATPDGGLLLGLRAPIRGGNALVVLLANPAAVVEGAAAVWGPVREIDLEGRGIRSMELIPGARSGYLIMAGPQIDSNEEFKLFRWSGGGPEAERLDGINLKGIKPEGMMQVPGGTRWQLASDDGDVCSDDDSAKRFRIVEIEIP